MTAAARSLSFFVLYLAYWVFVMEPVQWLLLAPVLALAPRLRAPWMRAWMGGQARFMLWLSQRMAGWHLGVEGAIPPRSCIVVMNHQSVLDVGIGLSLVRGPYALIPTRARYRWSVPGVSSMIRLAGYPFVAQRAAATRADLLALRDAADAVARGERSLLIFPEGHRSRNKSILPFMTSGLRLILRRAPGRPVYVVVVEGFRHLRSMRDVALRLAGTRAHAVVLGPFAAPAEPERIDAFIQQLHATMSAALERLPDSPSGASPRAQASGATA
ncbi:MAG TPA: lysophospholipid acyltransferase family protein [Terriglobales bacterium]|nr:lysophospholipid acyltransferase family protein [Terriglobales bacterium]